MILVRDHHSVLEYWAYERKKHSRPLRLITLDHHTDTSAPFRQYLKTKPSSESLETQETLLQKMNYKEQNTIREAISYLAHDEHIVTALKSNILSTAFVIAHNAQDTGLQTLREHQIVCYSVGRSQKVSNEEYDNVLETLFLQKAWDYFNHILKQDNQKPLSDDPYILDIDLDYFNTRKSFQPTDSVFFKQLLKKAALVTIATEPDYIKKCAIDPHLKLESILEEVYQWQNDRISL